MDRTEFDRLLGTEQGRVRNAAGFVAPEGQHLFVLGADRPGRFARLFSADHAEVAQSGTFGEGKILRCTARLRPPATALPGDLHWVAELRIDDEVVTSRALDRTRTLFDLAWCVAHLQGDPHTIAFRLHLYGSTVPANEIELPAFYVDALLLDLDTTRPAVINRNPEPNETNVPNAGTVSLDIVDVGDDGIDLAATRVYLNDVLAFDGGVFQPGFAGSHSQPQADTRRIIIDPAVSWGSEEVVTVHVLSQTVDGDATIDTSYSFTAADIIAPEVESASSIHEKLVRVIFNEPVAFPGALVAAAYTFERDAGAIAVPVNAVSVTKITDTEVEVLLDTEITPGAGYTVTVDGVTDTSGNATAAPTNDAHFVGYACPKPDEREWEIFEFIPQVNRSEDEGDLAKFIAVFQEIGDLLLCRVDRFTDLIDPDIAPIEFVEAMLDDLGNPFTFALSDIDKRRLAQVLVDIYKSKGTAPGIIAAIRFLLGFEVTISVPGPAPLGLGDWELGVDWILGSGDPADVYTFWVHSPIVLTDEERERIRQIVDYMKTAHEHFKIVEPTPPPALVDHLELGLSELGENWTLH